MNFIGIALFAATAAFAPLGDLDDLASVATNVAETIVVGTNSTEGIVSFRGGGSRLSVSASSSGAQVYVRPENGGFVWVPDDADLQFGGKRNADGSVSGTSTLRGRIATALESATNGMVTVQGDDWASVTNRLATFKTDRVETTVTDGRRITKYVIRADKKVRATTVEIQDVQRHSTSQGVITVEYPMYVMRRGNAYDQNGTMQTSTWRGPYYKKVAGELKWAYDAVKTDADLKGYTSSGVEAQYIKNYYTSSHYKDYSVGQTFEYNSSKSTSLTLIAKYNNTYWQGRQYSKNANMPLGDGIDFVDALKGTNSEEYVGYGCMMNPDVSGQYQVSKWYLDRSVGSGESFSYVGAIPYTWTETVTNVVSDEVYDIATSSEDLRFSVISNGLEYVHKAVEGTNAWNLVLRYGSNSATVSLPYRGEDRFGNSVWSYHSEPSKWRADPEREWGTVVWDAWDGTWKFTGGLNPWFVPSSGDPSGIYNFGTDYAWHVDWQSATGYPCDSMSYTGTVHLVSFMDSDTYGMYPFVGDYSRSVPFRETSVTNSIQSTDVDAAVRRVLPTITDVYVLQVVETNGYRYTVSPRTVNGSLIMIYSR